LGDSRFVGGGDGTVSLAQVRDLLVKVGESGFEGFAVVRIGCRFEVIYDSNARQLQVFNVLLSRLFLGAFRLVPGRPLPAFDGFDLRFDVFAFPASRHTNIVTQFRAVASLLSSGVSMRKRSRAGRPASR